MLRSLSTVEALIARFRPLHSSRLFATALRKKSSSTTIKASSTTSRGVRKTTTPAPVKPAAAGGTPRNAVKASRNQSSLAAEQSMLLSFDLGSRNLAYCLYDAARGEIREWRNRDITSEGVNTANLEQILEFFESFYRSNPNLFNNARVIIENQMSTRLRVMQAVLYTFLRDRLPTEVINARQIRDHFGISTGNYKRNKKLSISFCREQLAAKSAGAACSNRDSQWLDMFEAEKKKDDLAECFIQAVYYADVHGFAKKKRKRRGISTEMK